MQWWKQVADLDNLTEHLRQIVPTGLSVHPTAEVHPTVLVDTTHGPVFIDANCKICEGVSLTGPLTIGPNVLIGKNAQVRGPTTIDRDVLIGYNVEVKRAQLKQGVKLGPLSYVADSIIEEGVFFGAMVRTSNFRLDNSPVEVMSEDGQRVDTGMTKLGCHVGRNTSLGIGCKIYPGRAVPANSIFEMDVHIKKNLEPGHYRIKQDIEKLG